MLKIILTDNEEIKTRIREGLKKTGGYCPCELEHTPDTKCMCKNFREQNTPGACHCGLYVKEEV